MYLLRNLRLIEYRRVLWLVGIVNAAIVACEPVEDLALREPTDTLVLSSEIDESSVRRDTTQSAQVYFCTGVQSKSFHVDRNCKGLSNCEGYIQPIERDRVRTIDRSDPCDICVKDR